MTFKHNRTSLGVVNNLEAKTGRTLAGWRALIPANLRERRTVLQFLKAQYGLGHVQAAVITSIHLSDGELATDESLLDGLFSGDRRPVRSVYDALAASVRRLGTDVRVDPRKGYVAIRRSRQFAAVRPESAKLAVALVLGGATDTIGLEPRPGFIIPTATHRILLRTSHDVDATIERRLRDAYDRA
jgi:hypothetical protein